jgi:hypothetical protein
LVMPAGSVLSATGSSPLPQHPARAPAEASATTTSLGCFSADLIGGVSCEWAAGDRPQIGVAGIAVA